MDDLVFPLDLVCRFRDQFSRRFLPHHEPGSIASRKLVGGVRLPKSKLYEISEGQAEDVSFGDGASDYLLDVYWRLNFRDILRDESFKRRNVDWLPHDTSHCED